MSAVTLNCVYSLTLGARVRIRWVAAVPGKVRRGGGHRFLGASPARREKRRRRPARWTTRLCSAGRRSGLRARTWGSPAGYGAPRRAAITMLALAVPLALGTAPAKDQHLSLPTVAQVRAAADRLIAFVAGSHVATPKGPQQESGTAAGKPHEVPASATRATGRAAGRAPGKGPGQMPPYTVHAPKARSYTTGPANRAAPPASASRRVSSSRPARRRHRACTATPMAATPGWSTQGRSTTRRPARPGRRSTPTWSPARPGGGGSRPARYR